MNAALIKLSIERLLEKVEQLEHQNKVLIERVEVLEQKKGCQTNVVQQPKEQEDVLIDTKEVLNILGISYNTLRSIVRKQLIYPIRINQRRVRYSKNAIKAYIQSRSTKQAELEIL